MINVKEFYNSLIQNGTDFFCGVPDSLLKSFCAYVSDNCKNHIITVNEGAAIALASGYYLSTAKIPLVYMQNSGLGNAINPLLSLADAMVYSIPMILVIGWRGEPNIKDEPQHAKQGIVTCDLLDTMKIPYRILNEDFIPQITECYEYLNKYNEPFAFVVKKETFDNYKLQNKKIQNYNLTREKAIEICIKNINIKHNNTIFISTTGMASRELFELREYFKMSHNSDFLTVGSMGHCSQIALGIALNKTQRKIVCIDGDGATLMHMGSLATIGSLKPQNLLHIVINNAAHDSVGAQPTCADKINLCAIAKDCGYEKCISVDNEIALTNALQNSENKLTFIEIKTNIGARNNLGRPTISPKENKVAFMEYLK